MQKKNIFIHLLAIPTIAAILALAGCGGGSDSSSGGGSGSNTGLASISGNVSNSLASANTGNTNSMLTAVINTLIDEAHASGVPDVTVELLLGGVVTDTQVTNSSGEFRFTGLMPGNYSLRLSQNNQVIGDESPVLLSADTNTRIEMSVTGAVTKLEVNAGNGEIFGEIEDDISSDDSSSDSDSDDDSDDLSSDDDDSDEDSADDDSEDDVSDDD